METSVVLHFRHFPLKDKEIFYSRYLEEGKHLWGLPNALTPNEYTEEEDTTAYSNTQQ